MEKKNTRLIVLVIILCLLVLGLGGYIVYDKVLTKDNNNIGASNTDSVDNISNEKFYSYENVSGLYTYTAKTFEEGTDNEFIPIYKLFLYDNGTFFYLRPSRTPVGVVGNFIIKDDKILLNYWYNWSSGIQKMDDKSIKINSLVISKNDTLIDSNPFETWYDISEISLLKADSEEEKKFQQTFGDFSKIITAYME